VNVVVVAVGLLLVGVVMGVVLRNGRSDASNLAVGLDQLYLVFLVGFEGVL